MDVFFVISGFLITRQLIGDEGLGRGLGLLAFWARRLRRLVPALAVMVVATVAAATLILPALGMARVTSDARWALLYVANLAFARQADDYFTHDLDPSVLLHTWSLGVEEQFYLLWPVLLLALVRVARPRPGQRRRVLAAGMAAVAVLSFAWCLHQTPRAPAGAFFLLPTRLWELAAGGLLAALPLRRPAGPGRATALALAGGVAIVGAGATFGAIGSDRYPGPWPLIPVLGTAALVVAGTAAGTAGTPTVRPVPLLTHRGPQWLGRLSYSWYLWHWPVLVLGVRALDDGSTLARALLAAGSIGLAWMAHALVEDPVRFSPRLRASTGASYAVAAAITVLAVGAVAVAGWAADREVRQGPLAGLRDVQERRRDFTCAREATSPSGVEHCVDGDLDGDPTVVLVGDSHTRQWKPAFAEAARAEGIRLVVRWRPACPSVDVPTVELDGGGLDTTCQRFRQDTARLLEELRPAAVVRADAHRYHFLIRSPDDRRPEQLWYDQLRAGVEAHLDAGIRTGLVADNPHLPFEPVDCLAEHGEGDACRFTRTEGYASLDPLLAQERALAAEIPDLRVLDLTDTFCPGEECPLVIDRTYVYADAGHLTEPFVLTQVDEVRAYLRVLLR